MFVLVNLIKLMIETPETIQALNSLKCFSNFPFFCFEFEKVFLQFLHLYRIFPALVLAQIIVSFELHFGHEYL